MSTELLDLPLFDAPPSPRVRTQVTVVTEVQERCALCDQQLVYVAGKHDAMYVILAVLEDGSFAFAHKSCVMLKSKRPTVSDSVPRRMPPCARCSASFNDHMHSNVPPHTVCATVDLQEYLPAEPVRSRHWPYRMLSVDEYAQGVAA